MHGSDYKPVGTYREWVQCQRTQCRHCKSPRVRYRLWDSADGGYEDAQYKCQGCGYTWWVDGDDA